MRFSFFSTALLSSAAFAAVAPPSYDAPSVAESAPAYTSATITYYTTRTVMRVVETMTATRNGSASVYETTETSTATSVVASSSASATLYPMSNGTTASTTALATGALPSASGVYEGSASQLSVGAGMVLLAGFAGLLL